MSGHTHPAYRPLVYMVARTVALPHGYTLLIWATTMVMISEHGVPDVGAVFCMLAGACAAYILAGGLGIAMHVESVSKSGGWQPRMVKQPYMVATVNFVTLAIATGCCVLVAFAVPWMHIAWLAVGFTGTSVYLVGIALQSRIVDRILGRKDNAERQTESH